MGDDSVNVAGPPDITVDYSGIWAHATPDDDPDPWARATAPRLWQATGDPFSQLDVERLSAKLALLAEAALSTDCLGAFLLCPEPARGPVAVVRLNGMVYPTGTPEEAVIDDLLLPPAQQVLTPQVEHLPGGLRRVRLRQRAYDEETGTIGEYLTWVLPFDDAAWLLSVSFADHRVAEQWLPEIDALTEAVQVTGVAT